ncbi:glycosyltransferase [Sphingomonas paucimobilis]|uniref:glycosyltransferase n=1 Tax=Sphingomonas paucimobilis TaxID=13689 RepID=UPI0028D00A9F|nr:glycosyltransferase [Sphingomonas paucimobilis]
MMTVDQGRVASSLWSDRAVWRDVHLIDRRNVGLLGYLRAIRRESRDKDVVILNGALGFADRYCDLLAALVLRCGRRPWVVLVDCTWEQKSRALERRAPWLSWVMPLLSKSMVRLIDHDKTIYCVLSSSERAEFAERWKVDAERVVFTPFCHTMHEKHQPRWQGNYVFAGGNSLRDYPLITAAFRGFDMELRMATSYREDDLPANILCRSLPHHVYMDELRGARHVVVPLEQSTRSAGQQTYLNAMLLEKLVIVNDVRGVRDYIDDGETGLVVDSTPEAFAEAIRWAEDPGNQSAVDAIRQRAAALVERRHSLSAYLSHLRVIASHLVRQGTKDLRSLDGYPAEVHGPSH